MTRDDLVQDWLARARESLVEATMLAEAEHHFGSVNRIYYACFYAVTALLLSEGYSSSKHRGVLSLFDVHWMKIERLPAKMGRFYHVMFARRLVGDYSIPAAFSREEVGAWLAEATKFVQTIADLLQAPEA